MSCETELVKMSLFRFLYVSRWYGLYIEASSPTETPDSSVD